MNTKEEYLEHLREYIKPGDTVYCILRHVSQSGMSRRISLLTIDDNTPSFWDYSISKATGVRLHKDQGLVVRGCGMDMGFHLVDNLSWALFGEGNKLRHRWL